MTLSRLQSLTPSRSTQTIGLPECLFIVYVMLFLAGGLLPLVVPDTGPKETADSDRASYLLQVALCLMSMVFLLPRWHQLLRGLRAAMPVVLLFSINAISVIWSGTRAATIHSLMYLAITVALGVYLGVRLSIQQQIQFLCVVVGIAAIATVTLVVFAPWRAFDPYDGSLRGDFLTKNWLGGAMGLGAISFYFLPARRGMRLLRAAAIATCVALIVFADSIAPLVGLAVLVALRPALIGLRTHSFRRKLVAPICALLSGILLLVFNMEAFLNFVGRNSFLTGRIPVWVVVIGDILKRPWFGYGYGAYWAREAGNADYVARLVQWFPGQSHNGLLQICLSVGLLGLIVFLAVYAKVFKQAVRLQAGGAARTDLWPVAFLIFTMIHNMTESGLLEPYDLSTALFIALVVVLNRRHSARRRNASSDRQRRNGVRLCALQGPAAASGT